VNGRLILVLVVVLAALVPAAAQESTSPDIKGYIDRLGNFDYATRMNAARAIRRIAAAQAVPLLTEAVRSHLDQFVRYRALVLITAFNDRRTPDLMKGLLRDRNDRVREVGFRWFAAHPEPAMSSALLALLQAEQGEFVRPALIAALAAIGNDVQVQRALVAEAGRGLDFFRIGVIEVLGAQRAAYAVDTIAAAAKLDGPIQDDAVLALGRIGGARALETLATVVPDGPELTASMHAAQCMLGNDCPGRVKALVDVAGDAGARSQASRAAIAALGSIATKPDPSAMTALAGLAASPTPGVRDAAAVALSVVAVRVPDAMLEWLEALADEGARQSAYTLLRDGFERLEEDFAEEQFFAAARAAYWRGAEGSPTRTRLAALIETLQF
jgi:HEAT repeat protein